MNATFLLRLKAFFIDYLLILAYLAVLAVLSLYLFPPVQEWFSGSLVVAQLVGFIIVTLPVSLYFIISDSTLFGQSFGKKRTGIRVVDKDGITPSIARLTIRTLLKFLPWELSHYLVYRLVAVGDGDVPLSYTVIGVVIYVLIFAYILTAVFTKKKQSLYDLIVKTEVVKVSS